MIQENTNIFTALNLAMLEMVYQFPYAYIIICMRSSTQRHSCEYQIHVPCLLINKYIWMEKLSLFFVVSVLYGCG